MRDAYLFFVVWYERDGTFNCSALHCPAGGSVALVVEWVLWLGDTNTRRNPNGTCLHNNAQMGYPINQAIISPPYGTIKLFPLHISTTSKTHQRNWYTRACVCGTRGRLWMWWMLFFLFPVMHSSPSFCLPRPPFLPHHPIYMSLSFPTAPCVVWLNLIPALILHVIGVPIPCNTLPKPLVFRKLDTVSFVHVNYSHCWCVLSWHAEWEAKRVCDIRDQV